MERVTKVTDLYWLLRSETNSEYFLLSALLLRSVSNPIVNFRIFKKLSLVFRSISGEVFERVI